MKIIHSAATVEDTDSSITITSPACSTHLPLSRRSSVSSVLTATTISPEISTVQFSLVRMEGGIQSLAGFLDDLEKSTMNIGILGGDGKVDMKLEQIRGELKTQDKDFENGLKEVDLVFKDMMKTDIIRDIQREVEAQVEEEVERLVEEQFNEYLKELLPDALRTELAETRTKLEASRIALHNSESMRANALLRKERGDGPNRQIIQKLYNADGEVSPLFPKTLQDAFDLDQETCQALLQHYGVEVSPKAKSESLLNTFLKLCGIQYQFVNEEAQSGVRQVHDFGGTNHSSK